MLEKKSYLSERALSYYLLSTILATMSTSLGVVIDGVIVGQLLGVNALSAISLCTPLLQFITTLMMILNIGNALLVSISMGKGHIHHVKQYFSFAIILNATFGILLILLGVFFADEIARLLTSEEQLLPMVKEYSRVVLLSAPVYLLLPALSIFVRTDGAPRLTTIALIVANVANLLFDCIFIKYMGWGVTGSSLATTFGYLIGICVLAGYLLFAKSSLSFTKSIAAIDKKQAFILAMPLTLTSALMMVRIFGINHIVSNTLGAIGLIQIAVCFNLLMLVSMFVAGVSQSIQPVSGFMVGQQDYRGVSFVAKRALKILMVIIGIAVLLFELFPEVVLRIIGYKDSGLISQTVSVVRIVSISFIFFAVNYLLMVIYQLSRQTKCSLFISVAQPLVILPLLLGFNQFSPDKLWWSFLIGELLVLASCLIYSLYYRSKNKNINLLTLLSTEQSTKVLDLSISNATDLDFKEFVQELDKFLYENEVEKGVKYRIELCCEELLTNIQQYAFTNRKERFIDINVAIGENEISLNIKDDGISFNPLEHNDSTNIGLLIVKGICKEISYKCISGQNMIFVKF